VPFIPLVLQQSESRVLLVLSHLWTVAWRLWTTGSL